MGANLVFLLFDLLEKISEGMVILQILHFSLCMGMSQCEVFLMKGFPTGYVLNNFQMAHLVFSLFVYLLLDNNNYYFGDISFLLLFN